MSNPRAIGHCSLFPSNPNIYSTETYRFREVLATTWQVEVGNDWGLGAGIPPRSSVSEEREKPKLRTISGVDIGKIFLPFLSSSFPKFSASRVQCVLQRGCGWRRPQPSFQVPVLSSGARVIQWAMSSVCPVFAPPSSKGQLEEVQEDPIHRASWVGSGGF